MLPADEQMHMHMHAYAYAACSMHMHLQLAGGYDEARGAAARELQAVDAR